MHNSSLIAKDLKVSRSDRCLFSPLNFQLNAGEVLQILGENGVGKSTLLKVLAGLRSADAGVVLFNSQPIQEERTFYQAQLSYLGHRLGLKLNLNVKENLRGILADMDFLRQLGLEPHIHTLLAHLSQGQKQRVALARVYFSHKKIWILDEPFAALDQAGFDLSQKMMQEHLQKGGIIVLSTHRPLVFKQGVQTIYLENSHA